MFPAMELKRISTNDPFCFMGSWKSCYQGEKKCKYVLIITMKMFLSHDSSRCKRQLSILVITSDKTERGGISVMVSPPCWIYNPFNTAESGRKERGKEGTIFIWKRKNDSSITRESKDAACHPTSRLPPWVLINTEGLLFWTISSEGTDWSHPEKSITGFSNQRGSSLICIHMQQHVSHRTVPTKFNTILIKLSWSPETPNTKPEKLEKWFIIYITSGLHHLLIATASF